MGLFHSLMYRLFPSLNRDLEPPQQAEEEIEAKLLHEAQMRRLRVAICARKKINSSVEIIQKQMEPEKV
jgi:hypothetical protein